MRNQAFKIILAIMGLSLILGIGACAKSQKPDAAYKSSKSEVASADASKSNDIGDAGVATARFAINSTIGIAGLVDVAQSQGLSYKEEDFGQTLAIWGVGDGFYLVLPILGPSSLRDTAGLVVDSYADPVRIIAH